GHELTHGFDDEGSKFDGAGNLRNWWQPGDREEFTRRAQRLVRQFEGFAVTRDLHVNGRLTLDENIADLGGLTIAFAAFTHAASDKSVANPINGFSAQQRFFIAWARSWRENIRPEALRLQVQTNPHAPSRYRAIAPLQNLREFEEAFDAQPGDPMVLA